MAGSLERRVEKLEGRNMTEVELDAEFGRLSKAYRDDPGMKAVIDRIRANPLAMSLSDAILAARKRAGMAGSE